MFSDEIANLADQISVSFFTAYLLPAFVAVFGTVAIGTSFKGASTLARDVADLSIVGQSGTVLGLLLAMVMVALVLRALTRTILGIFAGDLLPAGVAGFLRHGQRRAVAKHAASSAPSESDALAPTALGNALRAAADYPWHVYEMDGVFWWARLKPLLPSAFSAAWAQAQAPMMGLLNLSLACVGLGLGAVIVVGVLDRQVALGVLWLVAGLVLARLCYVAAVREAGQVGTLIRVAFDLYRSTILQQLGVTEPTDLAKERALWQQLTLPRLDAATAAALAAQRATWGARTQGQLREASPVVLPPDAAAKRPTQSDGDDQ
jgi:hypothetical protein